MNTLCKFTIATLLALPISSVPVSNVAAQQGQQRSVLVGPIQLTGPATNAAPATVAAKPNDELPPPVPPEIVEPQIVESAPGTPQSELISAAADLDAALDRFSNGQRWREYLALPAAVFENASLEPEQQAALQQALARYNTVSRGRRLRAVSAMPEFRRAHRALRTYLGDVEAVLEEAPQLRGGAPGFSIGGDYGVQIGGGRGLRIGGPQGVWFGGGQGARFGGRNGAQFGGGAGARFGGENGVQFGGGSGAKFGPVQVGGAGPTAATPPRETPQPTPAPETIQPPLNN